MAPKRKAKNAPRKRAALPRSRKTLPKPNKAIPSDAIPNDAIPNDVSPNDATLKIMEDSKTLSNDPERSGSQSPQPDEPQNPQILVVEDSSPPSLPLSTPPDSPKLTGLPKEPSLCGAGTTTTDSTDEGVVDEIVVDEIVVDEIVVDEIVVDEIVVDEIVVDVVVVDEEVVDPDAHYDAPFRTEPCKETSSCDHDLLHANMLNGLSAEELAVLDADLQLLHGPRVRSQAPTTSVDSQDISAVELSTQPEPDKTREAEAEAAEDSEPEHPKSNGVVANDATMLDQAAPTTVDSTSLLLPTIEPHVADFDKASESTSSSKRKRSLSKECQTSGTQEQASPPKRIKIYPTGPIKLDEEDFHPPYTPLTEEEIRDWKGWVDVESEPVYLNTMLQKLGVRGVSAQEMYDLEESIASLPTPVYGLIFLFQYQDIDHIATGEACPNDVWFSNQLPATNACATIALMNILFNASNVNLGRPLTFFKEDTADLTPMERAHCINEHDFVRGIHNSFASRMDTLHADRLFATKYKKQKKASERRILDEQKIAARLAKEAALPSTRESRPARKSIKKSHDEKQSPEPEVTYESGNGFHYVAYIPVNGSIWRLDGMNPHPQNLGTYAHIDTWTYDCAPFIQARMNEFMLHNQYSYNLMALVKDPEARALESLAANVKLLQDIEFKLDGIEAGWRNKVQEAENDTLLDASTFHHLTTQLINAVHDVYLVDDVQKLLEMREETIEKQKVYRECVEVQQVKKSGEQLMVEKERMDTNPLIHKILLALEVDGVAGDLMDKHRFGGAK